MKASAMRRPLQIGTFLRKEAIDILHQPRLLLTLVIGPFLVMAIFGLGYRDSPAKLKTLFVAPAGSPFLQQVDSFADKIDYYVDYEGVTSDAIGARERLVDGDVDLVVTFPDDPLKTVLAGERAPITVIHTRLDPIERTAISFASQISVNQINGQILAGIVSGGQELAGNATNVSGGAEPALDALDAAIAANDPDATAAAIEQLRESTNGLSLAIQAADSLSTELGGAEVADDTIASLNEMRTIVDKLKPDTSPDDVTSATSRIREIVGGVEQNYAQFTAVDPSVLVQPFESQVVLAVPEVNNVADWYAPAAVVLMLQQFGVAFGALSFVRERQLGIVDVFRVAPLGPAETLLGKYVAYTLIGGAIGAALTGLVVAVIGVPFEASLLQIVAVMALSLFAATGLGFVISLASGTDAQAVQYTMIVLLASLFFSGFFLSVGQLNSPASLVGWLLPVTYGMQLLRDTMLRGAPLDRDIVLGLAAYGVVMFALALLGARRRMSIAR